MTSAYSSAGSNIALIKYWGKADVALNTAAVPSLSLTLDGMKTHTLVEFDSTLECDEIHLDGAKQVGKASSRAVKLLDAIRKEASSPLYARVLSFNNFPTAAGLASSASGFAALAGAARLAAGLDCSLPLLSSWARFCSASAARSVYPGFVELLAETESASVICEAAHLPLELLVGIVNSGPKAVGSTGGMTETAATSPYYDAWLKNSPLWFAEAKQALQRKDFAQLGSLMERSTFAMHASMWSSFPPLIYQAPATIKLIQLVQRLRAEGAELYLTMDAGPQVKVFVKAEQAVELLALLKKEADPEIQWLHCKPGPGIELIEGSAGQKRYAEVLAAHTAKQ